MAGQGETWTTIESDPGRPHEQRSVVACSVSLFVSYFAILITYRPHRTFLLYLGVFTELIQSMGVEGVQARLAESQANPRCQRCVTLA